MLETSRFWLFIVILVHKFAISLQKAIYSARLKLYKNWSHLARIQQSELKYSSIALIGIELVIVRLQFWGGTSLNSGIQFLFPITLTWICEFLD